MIGVALMTCCFALSVSAQDIGSYTPDTVIEWVHKYENAKPDFKPGDVLTYKDVERLRPFVPPGYLEQLNFPELKIAITAPRSHMPRKDYVDCTEKYQKQVQLKSDGSLGNYTCGQPFSAASLDPSDPQSGLKAAWNFEYKWQNFGLIVPTGFWLWVRPGGTHDISSIPKVTAPRRSWTEGVGFKDTLPSTVAANFGGQGTFQRNLQSFHQRVYFNHLAQLADQGGTLPIPNAKDFEYKEFTGFEEPFDIRGTAFIIYRYTDGNRADDAWAYIPNLRRVRRISAEVKSDSLLGTDLTLEDFYGFSGRELDWNWKFLGYKDVLSVFDPKDDRIHLYGPWGMVPDDQWNIRRVAVVERTPKDARHPFSAVINFIDAENWENASYHLNFDRKGKLWKVLLWQWKYSEDYKEFPEINHGVQAMTWQSVSTFDVQNNRGTVVMSAGGGGYPNSTAQHVESLYDINKLEEIHR
jgi:hypothetical protein